MLCLVGVLEISPSQINHRQTRENRLLLLALLICLCSVSYSKLSFIHLSCSKSSPSPKSKVFSLLSLSYQKTSPTPTLKSCSYLKILPRKLALSKSHPLTQKLLLTPSPPSQSLTFLHHCHTPFTKKGRTFCICSRTASLLI